MKGVLFLAAIIILSSFVYADCVVPYDGMVITEDTTFCEGEYYLPNGISIGADNVVLDCNGAKLIGIKEAYYPFPIHLAINNVLKNNITIMNCNITNYDAGLFLGRTKSLIKNNQISNSYIGIYSYGTDDTKNLIENNEIYLNNFGIYLFSSINNTIYNNEIFSNAWYGIHSYSSSFNKILENEFYSNGLGVHLLFGSSNNLIEHNNFNDITNLYASDNEVNAKNNYWGTIEILEISNTILDFSPVTFVPFLCEPYPTNFISNENGECIADNDNDGIPNSEDKCPDTIGEQVVYGCSCEQISDLKPGKDKGLYKEGCNENIIDVFTRQIGWAKDLF